jgi:outer membrane protein TolC
MDQAENAERSLALAAQAMDLANRRWQLANAGLEQVENEFKLGNVSQRDVEAATDGLYAAESANASSRSDYFAAWSDYLSLVGADPAMNALPARRRAKP